MLCAIRHRLGSAPGREARRALGSPEGRDRPGEKPAETALREVSEETGVRGRLVRKLGDVRYVYTWAGERVFKVVSFYLLEYAGGRWSGTFRPEHAHEAAGALAPLADAPEPPATRANARWRSGRSLLCETTIYDARGGLAGTMEPMYALNFYSPIVADQLRTHRKTATIRLGDKSSKYRKGMIVQVLCGARYSPRERIFDAVIDKVDVKRLGDLRRTRFSTTTRR